MRGESHEISSEDLPQKPVLKGKRKAAFSLVERPLVANPFEKDDDVHHSQKRGASFIAVLKIVRVCIKHG